MEDQPTDSGDLTTDASRGRQTSTPRRRHRMPRGKERRALEEEPDAAQVDLDSDGATADEPPSAVELTSSTAEEPAAEQPKRRRWNFLRRRKNRPPQAATEQAATEQVASRSADDTPTTADAATAPRTPVGKAGRSAKQDSEPETTSDDEPVAEPSDSDTGGETTESTESAGEEPILVPHRPAGKRLKIAAAAAAVLFVAGGAFLGAMAQPVIANRASVRDEAGHRPHRPECDHHAVVVHPGEHGLACRPLGPLSHRRFRVRSTASSSTRSSPPTSRLRSRTPPSVLGTAVESVTPSEATAIVYTNSVATSPVSKNIPSLRYLSYRLEMKRDRRRLAHHPDDDGHHAGSDPAAVGRRPCPSPLRSPNG